MGNALKVGIHPFELMRLFQSASLLRGLMLLAAAGALGGLTAGMRGAWHPPSAPHDPWRLEAHQIASLPLPLLWVDARSESDYQRGHLPGAVHLPPEAWNERLGALLERVTGELTVVVYCNPGCGSAEEVARRLRELGIERVHTLEGGYREDRLNH